MTEKELKEMIEGGATLDEIHAKHGISVACGKCEENNINQVLGYSGYELSNEGYPVLIHKNPS